MTKYQYVALLAALVLFCGLYFGFDTKPAARHTVDRSRALQGEATSLESLLGAARQRLSAEQTVALAGLDQQVEAATSDAQRIEALKQLSGRWYDLGELAIAGSYAERVAELENADTAWSVAGATFYHALIDARDPQVRDFSAQHAVKAFESAVSLNPDYPEHRVNLALVYAEAPPPDNPMQAVLMLRELEAKYPDAPGVYNALGRLAIKTGQWPRAIERLEKARSLDPTNPNTPCLLARAYEGAGQAEKAAEYAKRCK